MSRLVKHRRAGVLAATVAAGVLGFAAPAAAGVTVNPPSAPQGSAQNLAFHVINTAQTPIRAVRLVLPAAQPVAEVYPLSVENWAPKMEIRTLPNPITPIEGGEPITQVTAAITWSTVPGKELAPGASADLTVAMGPVPVSGDTMGFTVEPVYADPAKAVAMAPVTLALTPAVAGQEYGGHAAHTGGGAAADAGSGDTSAADDAAFAALAEAANDGPGFWTVAGWVVAALLAVAAGVVLLRARRPAAAAGAGAVADGPADPGPGAAGPAAAEQAEELVGARTKGSAWRYQE